MIFHKAVFKDGRGEADGIVGAIIDISERKALERRLERMPGGQRRVVAAPGAQPGQTLQSK